MTIEELKKELALVEAEQQRLANYAAALRQAIELHPTLTSRDQYGKVGHKMEAQVTAAQNVPRGPGRPAKSKGPFAQAAKNAGIKMNKLAKILGISYGALKMADSRQRASAEIVEVLSRPPYSVPASAWQKK